MRSTRLCLLSTVIMAVVVVAGCDDGKDSTNEATKPGGNATATVQPTATTTPTGAPVMDAGTKTACTAVTGDIKTTTANVAKAEKIGPPAGHSAVSAQYSAGAASIYAHVFTANAEVSAAAKQVATAMSDLADKYVTAPKKAPSKAALNAAVKDFKAACAAS